MPFIPPPDPMGSASGRNDWQSTHGDRPSLPTVEHVEYYKQTKFARRLDEHIAPYAVVGAGELQAYAFFLIAVIPIHVVMQNWEVATLLLLFIALNFMAAYHARKPECSSLWGRLLCAVYFSTTRSSVTHRPILRSLRLPILFAGVILPLFSFAPIIQHHRQPLVDPRLINWRSGEYWDYLREHDYFRISPPPAQTPENQSP
jgi:hypothetical protein